MEPKPSRFMPGSTAWIAKSAGRWLIAMRSSTKLLPMVFSAALGLAACDVTTGPGGFGAIIVRWQLIDEGTGVQPTGCSVPGHSDYCCAALQTGVNHGTVQVVLDEIYLDLKPVPRGGGAPITDLGFEAKMRLGDAGSFDCNLCTFACGNFELATNYDIPAGDYVIALQGRRCGVPVANTPPFERRTIRNGEVNDLDSIEILLTAYSPTAAFLACRPPPKPQ